MKKDGLYSMKEAGLAIGLTYEGLKFYCKEGLVPRLKRDERDHRRFDERDLSWLSGLMSLRDCGFSIKDMKDYMRLCQMGPDTIKMRQQMLEEKREQLQQRVSKINEAISYIDQKQAFYEGVLRGDIPYVSNLTDEADTG